MDLETLNERLAEVKRVMAQAQANIYAMQGQEIEINFWISELLKKDVINLVKKQDESAV